MIFNIISEDQ